MPQSDSAAALALIDDARAVVEPMLDRDSGRAQQNHAARLTLLLADIAAAAVRLTMRTVPNGEPWYLATDGRDGWCWACEATGGHRAMPFDHAPGCPALALDAAIRAVLDELGNAE